MLNENVHLLAVKSLFILALLFYGTTNLFAQANLLLPYKKYFDTDLDDWTQSFKNFQLSKFKLHETCEFSGQSFDDIKNLKAFYKLYKPALSFSPDSSQFIDIYSYMLNLEKKRNKIVAHFAGEQAISLCDFKKNKWIQILFCGFSTRIDEAIWITNTKFILVGSVMDEKSFHPRIIIGETNKQLLLSYVDSTCVSNKNGYTSQKFKKLNVSD